MTNFLPDSFRSELEGLQDQVPPPEYGAIERRFREEFGGRGPRDLFASFEERPVASASIGQVHLATLPGGHRVAVKVQYPDIDKVVRSDLRALRRIFQVIERFIPYRGLDAVYNEIRGIVLQELDFTREAENNRRFHANFASWADRVTAPELIPSHCSERVLTMEFIRGVKVDALAPGHHLRVAEVVRTMMFKMCFDDGFLHADLHPDNMFVRDDGQLVVLDLGLCKLLHDDVLIQFIDMSKCLAMGTPADLVAHLRRFHVYLGEVDWDQLSVEVEAFARKFRAQDVAQLDYGNLINEMFAIGRRYHVRPVTDMTLVLVCLVTAQGIGKMLEPEINVGIGFLALSYLTYGIAQSWLFTALAMVAYWLGFSVSIHSCATVCGNCLANEDRATGMMIVRRWLPGS